MHFDVVTLFPAAIENYVTTSVLGRAREAGVFELALHDVREATSDVHRSVDDTPYGGGAGMVLRPGPLVATIEERAVARPVIFLSPVGRVFTHDVARELSALEGVTLVCGRYEGFDERAIELVGDDVVSVGDFVLAGGELAALCVLESVVRLLPGALGNDASSEEESFARGLLEYPHYTKPAVFRGRAVPEILRSGDHARIARWRHAQSLVRTRDTREDLWTARGGLSEGERDLLEEFGLTGSGENG